MVGGALAEEHGDGLAQLSQPPVALHQFLADFQIFAQLDQFGDRFAQVLDRQGEVVLDQLGTANAQFRPFPAPGQPCVPAAKAPFPGLTLQVVARHLHLAEELIGRFQQLSHELHCCALAQCGEQPLFGAGVPEAVQGVADLATGNAQADVFGGDVLHLVRLVEDHEVIAEQDAALRLLLDAPEQGEEQGVVEHQHVRRQDAVAGALEETDAVLLGELGGVATEPGRTEPALGADLRPHLRVGFNVEV